MTNIIIKNEQATITLARQFAKKLKGGDIVLLEGELGAGKTVFVKGLARAFKIKERIKSPTFVLMRQHEIKNVKCKIKNLVHCDAYRVEKPQELAQAGLADWLGRSDTIVIVEWGEKIKPLLRGRKYKMIKFQHGKTENERIIELPTLFCPHLH